MALLRGVELVNAIVSVEERIWLAGLGMNYLPFPKIKEYCCLVIKQEE